MPIYKLKDGKYRININYKDPISGDYKQKSKRGIKTKAEAMQIEAQMLIDIKKSADEKQTDLDNGILSKLTIHDLAEDYLATQNRVLKRTTLRGTVQVFKDHILPYFGQRRLVSLSLNDFRVWKNSIEKYTSLKTHEKLKLNAKKNIYKKFNVLLNYAYKYYGYQNIILPRVGDFKELETIEAGTMHYWTLEQFNIFIELLHQDCLEVNKYNKWCMYVMFNILFFCGLRKGEAYALKWSDLITKGEYKVLSIRKSLSQKVRDENGDYYISTPKNKSSARTVPLPKFMEKILKEHYQRSQSAIPFFNDDMYICGGPAPISDTWLDKTKNTYAQAAGIPIIKIHDFRHSFVTLLINADINIKTISALVGHATVDQTWNTYGHLYPESQNKAIEYLDDLVSTKSTKKYNNTENQ